MCVCVLVFIKSLSPIKNHFRDFSDGLMVKNPPANAWEHGFNPFSRKIPQATEQLSPYTTTTETVHSRACAPQEKSLQWQACTQQKKK